MAKSLDTLVEIPPPETEGNRPNWWAIGVVSLFLIAGVVVFVFATEPRAPAFEWSRGEGPTSVNLDSMVALENGFAVLSGITADGVLLWWTKDGAGWETQPLSGNPRQLAALATGLLAYDGRDGMLIVNGGAGWVTSESELRFPDDIRARQSSGRPSVIPIGDGFIAVSVPGDLWWTEDRSQFQMVVSNPDWGRGETVDVPFDAQCLPPTTVSPDVPPLVATDAGFVALISSDPDEPFGIWPVCEPEPWLSEDGSTWVRSDASLGDGAYVYDMASRNGLLVAVGGRGLGDPAVWVSDGGEAWQEVGSFSALSGVDLYTVEAGPAGWVILAKQSNGPGTLGWTSTDGSCWESLPSQVSGLDAAVSDEQLIVIDRTAYPSLWVGTATGSGSC